MHHIQAQVFTGRLYSIIEDCYARMEKDLKGWGKFSEYP